MKIEEKAKIEKALASENPTKTIPSVCREIVMERIDSKLYADRELRFLVKDIIKASDFGCEVEIEEISRPGSNTEKKSNLVHTFLLGAISIGAIIGASVSEKSGLRLFWSLSAAISAFYSGRMLISKDISNLPTTYSRLVAVTNAEEILKRIDKFTLSLMALFDYRQIEGTHKDFLKWLQTQYSENENEEFRRNVTRLLGRFGYHLEDFSDSKIEDFDVTEANIEDPVTTLPALYNQDNRLMFKGHYLVPKK